MINQFHKVIARKRVVAGSALLVSWDCGDTVGSETQLQVFQEDSGTVTSTSVDFTPVGFGATGHAAYIDADAVCNFACTDGVSIDLDQGTFEFEYRRRAVPDSYAVFFLLGDNTTDFQLKFYTAIGDNIQFRYGGNRYDFPVPVGSYPFTIGTFYSFKFTYDPLGSVDPRLWIDAGEVTGGSWTTGTDYGTKPTITSNVMHIGDNGTGTYNALGDFDNFKVYSEVL